MTRSELRISFALSSVYALRMLGMFLVYPVFALYSVTLPGHQNIFWIGFSFGVYGLTQALLQLPLGMYSDKVGRKCIIYFGLIVLAIGSVIAALAPNIQWLALGRAIQGAGAISSVVTALLADLTREENRTKAMAIVGVSIGLTFSVSLVLSPLLAHYIGVRGIFVLTGILSLLTILLVKFVVPTPAKLSFHSGAKTSLSKLPSVLKNKELLRLDFGVFALHAAQMAMFVSLPFALVKLGLDKSHHWKIYLPVVLFGLLLMVPTIIYAEKYAKIKAVFIAAIVLMVLSQIGLVVLLHNILSITFCLGFYFVAFSILESCLPSLISKIAPADAKGTAMGVYNTAQSIGLFVGASAGAWLYQSYGFQAVYSFNCLMIVLWLICALRMKVPLIYINNFSG